MRERFLPSLLCVATALGCGDGIGRPIVEQESSASGAAGTPGPPGGSGGAGNGGGGNGGAESGAGSSAFGGFPSFGGREWRGPDGEGRGEPPPDVQCDGIDEWPEESARMERAVFGFLNFARDYGLPCGSGSEVIVPPVVMKRELQCAARRHSRDMFDNDFFGHEGSDGSTYQERIQRAGYTFGVAGETIAESNWDGMEMVPYRALEELFVVGGTECDPLVDPSFDSVGIGFFGDLWTLDFAGP